MHVIVMIGQILLALSILIVLHELGHFAAARAFGIRVEKFYLFFDAYDFKLFSFKHGETEYGIGWLPLGGYVKIAGMIDESLDTTQLKTEPEPWEFRSKPAWQRLIVMVGGVVVNLVLAMIIFAGLLFVNGEQFIPTASLKNGVVPSEMGKTLGMQTGDIPVAVNGMPLKEFSPILTTEIFIAKTPPTITVMRGTQNVNLQVPATFIKDFVNAPKDQQYLAMPRFEFTVGKLLAGRNAERAGLKEEDKILGVNGEKTPFFDEFKAALKKNAGKYIVINAQRSTGNIDLKCLVEKDGSIGFRQNPTLKTETKSYSFAQSIPAGIAKAYNFIGDYIKGMGKLFSGDVPVQKSLGGPIAIAQDMYGGVWDWTNFWNATAILSAILAFMNILPIPALDGGHVVFLLIEMITRRPVGEKVLLAAQYVGMVLVFGLMIFVFGNDIWQRILH